MIRNLFELKLRFDLEFIKGWYAQVLVVPIAVLNREQDVRATNKADPVLAKADLDNVF